MKQTAQAVRESMGISREELAKRVGVEASSLKRYESSGGAGERTARLLSLALGVPAQCYMVGSKYPAEVSPDFRAVTREATATGHRQDKRG